MVIIAGAVRASSSAIASGSSFLTYTAKTAEKALAMGKARAGKKALCFCFSLLLSSPDGGEESLYLRSSPRGQTCVVCTFTTYRAIAAFEQQLDFQSPVNIVEERKNELEASCCLQVWVRSDRNHASLTVSPSSGEKKKIQLLPRCNSSEKRRS